MTPYHVLNIQLMMESVVEKLAAVEYPTEEVLGEEWVRYENPDTEAEFPVCVVQAPQIADRNKGLYKDISITIEVWARSLTETMALLNLVECKMIEAGFSMKGNTPQMKDEITKAYRYGGYFESTYDAIFNTLERK